MIDYKLNEKEEKVYKLLLKGLSAPVIADKLGYTRDYTNYCKKRIYFKMVCCIASRIIGTKNS